MNRNTKIIVSVLAVGVTATTIFLLLKRRKKRKEAAGVVGNTFTETEISNIKTNPLSVTNPPSPTQIANVVATGDIELAIKNKEDGNKFRGWVNDNYPAYAKEIDLDRTGSYNNSFIKKAWKKYGAEYSNQETSVIGNIAESINNVVSSNAVQNIKAAATDTIGKVTTTIGGGIRDYYDTLFGRVAVENTTGAFSPKVAAETLYNSMKGLGTNEELFFDTLRPLTPAQRIQVREYYDSNGVGKSLGTLEMSVRGDFGGLFSNKKQLEEALNLIGL